MSWTLLKSESVSLPRAKALEYAARHAGLPHSPVEREIDPSRVAKLVAVLREGRALPFNWATVSYQDQTVRMNGQHSSAAIIEVGAEIPELLTFHMDQYQAADRAGMVDLFRQFDQRWSSRTVADVAGAYQGLVPELAAKEVSRKALKAAAEAISWCKNAVLGEDAPRGDNTYDLLHVAAFTPFFLWFNGVWNGRRELLRKEVIAAMWRTYDISQSWAAKFWREVSFGPDFFTDDTAPGAVLSGELNRALEDREFRDKEFEVPAFYYKKAIKAWNAMIAGQRITSLKVQRKGWPDVARPSAEAGAA
jgi:hypothetical protein